MQCTVVLIILSVIVGQTSGKFFFSNIALYFLSRQNVEMHLSSLCYQKKTLMKDPWFEAGRSKTFLSVYPHVNDIRFPVFWVAQPLVMSPCTKSCNVKVLSLDNHVDTTSWFGGRGPCCNTQAFARLYHPRTHHVLVGAGETAPQNMTSCQYIG